MKKNILLGLFILSLSGHAQTASKLKALDTRNNNEPPTFYNVEAKFEFKERTVVNAPGIGTYSGLLTLAPWIDNTGGHSYQLNFNDGGIYYRKALIDAPSWGSWMQFITANSNGYVGIGHSAPQSALHIKGTNNLSSQIRLENTASNAHWKVVAKSDNDRLSFQAVNSSDSEVLSLSANGNVGIGTITPSSKFNVIGQDVTFFSSTVENTFYMGRNGSEHFEMKMGDNHGYLDLNQDVDENNGHIFFIRNRALGTSPDNDIRFQTSSTDRLTIKGSGNVGIGTISPASTLHVSSSVSNAATIRLGRANNLPDDYLEVSTVGGGGRFTQTGGSIDFYTSTGTSSPNNFSMRIAGNGNIGIGTTAPGTYKLAVEGKIGARSVKVTTANWADYVFAPTYNLMSLPETEAYIKENQHLPDIPSAAEVKANGFHLEEMDAKLLAKIEELTLHLIAQEKILAAQQAEIQTLKTLLKKNENK